MAASRIISAADVTRQSAQVWVPDIKEGYLAGLVLSEDEEAAVVELEGGEVCKSFMDKRQCLKQVLGQESTV